MRVLFLDVDGVLNSVKWLSVKDPDTAKERIDPLSLEKVNKVVHETGATVVLTSDLGGYALHEINETLRQCGAEFTVSSTVTCKGENQLLKQDEISDWLTNQNFITFSILDDDDMPDFKDNHVQVDYVSGITNDDASKAVEILSGRM